jgi:hypothetical protein
MQTLGPVGSRLHAVLARQWGRAQIINAKANAVRWKNEILTAFLCISSKRFYICTPVSG